MRCRLLAIPSIAIAVQLFAGVAAAHPHVFITHTMTLIFGDRDIAGVRMSWTFDEMYSSMIKTDYAAGRSGPLTKAEIAKIEKDNFANLANYGFFLDLKINDKPVAVRKVKDFAARFADNRAIFEFTVPLETKEPREQNVIELAAFDAEYYVEFTLKASDPVTVSRGEGLSVDCTVRRNEKKISTLGPIDTDLAVCTYTGKP